MTIPQEKTDSSRTAHPWKALRTEIIINASPEKVWNILTDFTRYAEWNPFIISSAGEAKKGTRLTNVMKNSDKNRTFKPLVLTAEVNQKLEWIGRMPLGMFNGRHYFILEAAGNGQTRLIQGENFSGWLSGFIMKRIGAETKANFVAMNEALKKRAEQ